VSGRAGSSFGSTGRMEFFSFLMLNEFGEIVRSDRHLGFGYGGASCEVGVDCREKFDQEAGGREVKWENCFIFLFGEKPTAKESLAPHKSIRVKRAMSLAGDCQRKLEVYAFLNKRNGSS